MKKRAKKYSLRICEWSKDDRPREKLLKYGDHTLSNAELLAILIRTGTPGGSAVDIGTSRMSRKCPADAYQRVSTYLFNRIKYAPR